jgi:Tol biopolymer transport system component
VVPVISPDGRFVAFTSLASDLVANDVNGTFDFFVRDMQMTTTTLIPSIFLQNPLAGLSVTGRLVGTSSDPNQPEPRPVNTIVLNLFTGATTLLATDKVFRFSGVAPAFSGDGRIVAFATSENGIVPNDGNNQTDVFVRPSP